jgi:hypothetical protein
VKLWLDEVAMGAVTAGVLAAIRSTFHREALPPAPPPEPPRPAGRGLLALLFAPEPLPPDLPSAPARAGRWLSWLLAAEPLDP